MRVNPKDVAMMAGIALASVGAGLQFGVAVGLMVAGALLVASTTLSVLVG